MRDEVRFFEVTPRVVPAGRESEIVVRPLYEHCRIEPGEAMEVRCFPCEELGAGPVPRPIDARLEEGALRVRGVFEAEQEHVILVETAREGRRVVVGDFRVYSLEADLYARRPYRGDLHMHSCRSDGREAPAYVAACCRRIGLDFMALTDHRRYEPSLEAMRAYEGVPIDLRLYPGEEVHPPANPVHMVNFGGSFSVNALFGDRERYEAGVRAVLERLGDPPPGVDAYQYASCVWCFERIREGGGLGIFCHPYWFTNHRYEPAGALTSHLLREQPYGALEVIGGYHLYETESNALQVARYHEERAAGRRIPIVGVSDAHGCERGELFGWYWTLVFARRCELADLIDAITDLHSVAVEALPGQAPRAHGPFRLAKYAQFLLREVLPLHDALCEEEGRLMLAHVAGDGGAAERLAALRGQAARLMERLLAG